MIAGEDVLVELKEQTGTDAFNAPIFEPTELLVQNVLVAPGPRTDITASNRPDAHLVKYTLHFPKTFDGNLEELRVNVRGRWLRVVGAPDHYTPENTPGEWWMPVEVEAVDG